MKNLIITIMLLSLVACNSVNKHVSGVRDDTNDRVTIGKVQKEVKVGMTTSQVAEAMGSPNIVSTDEHRHEVWIYDKIATERVHSNSASGLSLLLLNTTGGSGASSTRQRTMTVIVKFDGDSRVKDFAYHTSSF